jgi:biofilm PGA synthesis N-glycosyltransferase PgaC
VLVFYFALFMIANIAVAAVAVRLMHEPFTHLLMVPIYRLVYEPLRAYLLYSSTAVAIKGVRMGWRKLQRTGSLDESTAPNLELRVQPVPAVAESSSGSADVGHTSIGEDRPWPRR